LRLRLDDDERPHRVVFLVLENVAVPHILMASAGRAWHRKRKTGHKTELHDHGGDFTGIHADGLLP
jgi:hypothetical protein